MNEIDALRTLGRDDPAPNPERFSIVGDLLRETVAAPKLRAALYRVAAGLGGVELVGSMTDRAGRIGTAVSMTNDQSSRGLERRVLIFDPETTALNAEEDVLLHEVDWLNATPAGHRLQHVCRVRNRAGDLLGRGAPGGRISCKRRREVGHHPEMRRAVALRPRHLGLIDSVLWVQALHGEHTRARFRLRSLSSQPEFAPTATGTTRGRSQPVGLAERC